MEKQEAHSPSEDGNEPACDELVRGYASLGATDREIADRFLIDESELRRRFGPVLRRTRARRALRLRQWQTNLAKELNGAMLTWLGRNELGQSNNPSRPGEAEPELDEKVG